MATKTRKKTTKRTVSNASPTRHKSVSDCTVRECIQENKVLKMHVTIITVLSVAVCLLVIALILAVR